ncbi:hypothetical protein EVAR_58166_1 [Eumeta japonica]|uniref:Uncharacterized protein n=1 Tax=Eumeta variegata TaxID=151549 RepID=A0A4C1X353_EUMVA|nr:hypothetical protein EVAR_58166_1 [Eumeta japonica]
MSGSQLRKIITIRSPGDSRGDLSRRVRRRGPPGGADCHGNNVLFSLFRGGRGTGPRHTHPPLCGRFALIDARRLRYPFSYNTSSSSRICNRDAFARTIADDSNPSRLNSKSGAARGPARRGRELASRHSS